MHLLVHFTVVALAFHCVTCQESAGESSVTFATIACLDGSGHDCYGGSEFDYTIGKQKQERFQTQRFHAMHCPTTTTLVPLASHSIRRVRGARKR